MTGQLTGRTGTSGAQGANITARITSELPAWAAGMYAAMEAGDIDGVLAQMSEDIRMRYGNAEPVVGRDAVRAASAQFFGSIGGLSHDFREVWESEDSALLVCDVDYTLRDGSVMRLPGVTFIHHRPDGIDDIQVFMDMCPLMA
jgi:ketosteroid isomerase-like protein